MTAAATWFLILFLANGEVGWQVRTYADCQVRAMAITAGLPQYVDKPDGSHVRITRAQCLSRDEALRRYFGVTSA
jgi:hypothetical protein